MTNFGIVDLYSNGIHVELNGVQIAQIKIPTGYVSHNFAPILGTHLLITGDRLVNGMIVVLEDEYQRGNPNDLSPENPDRGKGYVPSEYDRRRIEEGARWALVTDLKIVRNGPDSQLAKFTAIYADGTMRDRTFNVSYKWAVLNDYEALAVCKCGKVHVEEETASSVADDPEAQPFFDMMDAAADLIGTLLFPEAKTQAERITSVKKSIQEGSNGLFGDFLSFINEDDEKPEGPRPDESADEYQDRLRDEAQAAGEYDPEERPKLKISVFTPPKMATSEELAALRSKLMGE